MPGSPRRKLTEGLEEGSDNEQLEGQHMNFEGKCCLPKGNNVASSFHPTCLNP